MRESKAHWLKATLPATTLSLVLASNASAFGPLPPDQVDVFFNTPLKPNVNLLWDNSCSMKDKQGAALCSWYQNDAAVIARWSGGGAPLSNSKMQQKHHQLRATLVGCMQSDDGIIDRWFNRVNFSSRTFACGTDGIAGFGVGQPALESAIINQGFSCCTDMGKGLRDAWLDFQGLNDATVACRPNAIVFLSDGYPTGGNTTMSWPGCTPSRTYSQKTPWCHAAYLAGNKTLPGDPCGATLDPANTDVLCNLPNNQLIRTFTIFQGSKAGGLANMKKIAQYGAGEFFYGNTVSELDVAFETIINSTFNLPQVAFQTGTVDIEGPFVYNNSFPAMFKPASARDVFWVGNLKKFCILPNLQPNGEYDATGTCMFLRDPVDKTQLIQNPNPVDQWTGNSLADAGEGGAGAKLLALVTGNLNYPRKLVTWKDGTGLIDFRHLGLSADDMWIHGVERFKAINRVHGYAYDNDVTDNDDGDSQSQGDSDSDDLSGLDLDDHKPTGPASWALGEAMDAKPVLVSYESGNQFLLYTSNDGILHVFNAANGVEISGLIPRHVVGPQHSRIANFSIRDAMTPSGEDVRHVFLFDSTPRVFHDDLDADGRIDAGETAYIVVGLGRAGAAYYRIDISGNWDGVFSSPADSPKVSPLARTPGSHYEDLADTWYAPWLGKMVVSGTTERVAIFGSGHEREWDYPTAKIADAIPGQYYIDPDLSSPPNYIDCPTLIGTTTTATVAAVDCDTTQPPNGPIGPNDFMPGGFHIGIGPIGLADAVAYRVKFDIFDLDINDQVHVNGGNGATAQILRGNLGAVTSEWVYNEQLAFFLHTDGNPSANLGIKINGFEWRTKKQEPPRRRSPSIYVVNLDKWNGAAPTPWVDPKPVDLEKGVLMRFTADCNGTAPCNDEANFPDLKYMRCAISAEPAVLTAGGKVDRFYVGDECGQIWRVKQSAGSWAIKRVLMLNSDVGGGAWPEAGPFPDSIDVRKLMTRLDLVRSRCTGKNAVGIYFGTGNMQRPNAEDELPGRRDLIGVVWDDESLSSATVLADLEDVSAMANIDPKSMGKKGWYVQLGQHERALRQPAVFAQTAYYKVYSPPTSQTECTIAGGTDSIYVMDSCTSEAKNDADNNGIPASSERKAQSYTGQIGSPPNIIVTRDTAVVVGEKGTIVKKTIGPAPLKPNFRRARLLLWRMSR